MILGFITLLIAIAISAVSAYYSILGLVAIFAAAALPVIIMGSALEAGKIMTAVWLHRNWHRSSTAYKLYLVPAVVFLMLLTSLSVFGFLSKAHLDQGVPTDNITAQIELIDTKIATQRENINAARKVLIQMDSAVDEVLARSKTEQGARNANTLRLQQSKDRTKLTSDIGQAQTEIAKLTDQRAEVSRDLRRVEAEVGPIKYVAALIYGDRPNADLLERAVRWIIMLIVAVFDPLAIVLILAATQQIRWAISDRKQSQIPAQTPETPPAVDTDVPGPEVIALADRIAELEAQVDGHVVARTALDDELSRQLQLHQSVLVDHQALTEHAELLTTEYATKEQELQQLRDHFQYLVEDHDLQQGIMSNVLQRNQDAELQLSSQASVIADLTNTISELQQALEQAQTPAPPAYPADDGALTDSQIQQIQEAAADSSNQRPVMISRMFDPMFNPDAVVPATPPLADFGSVFPASPRRGDMFLRTDFSPSRLFKWNDQTWIQINKAVNDVYAYNDDYIQYLIEALRIRKMEWDDLTNTEQQQVTLVVGGSLGTIR